jgi:hypothetical protein
MNFIILCTCVHMSSMQAATRAAHDGPGTQAEFGLARIAAWGSHTVSRIASSVVTSVYCQSVVYIYVVVCDAALQRHLIQGRVVIYTVCVIISACHTCCLFCLLRVKKWSPCRSHPARLPPSPYRAFFA